jgi:hypothetical protein
MEMLKISKISSKKEGIGTIKNTIAESKYNATPTSAPRFAIFPLLSIGIAFICYKK